MKTSPNSNSTRSSGFTLVEMLVTITIIVALAGLATVGTKKLAAECRHHGARSSGSPDSPMPTHSTRWTTVASMWPLIPLMRNRSPASHGTSTPSFLEALIGDNLVP